MFRYVDDFLVFLDYSVEMFDTCVADTLVLFKERLGRLNITHEVPENGLMRFFDLSFALCVNRVLAVRATC